MQTSNKSEGFAVCSWGKKGWLAGVLIRRQLSAEEKRALMAYNEKILGHIGVRKNWSGNTAVLLTLTEVVRKLGIKETRAATLFLSRIVASVTKVSSDLYVLPVPRDTSRTLAS